MKTKKIKSKKIISAVLCILMLISICLPIVAFGATLSLESSNTLRNKISHSWTYKYRGLWDNNCLAWALGNTTDWIWPWKEDNPTLTQMTNYLTAHGYKHTGNQSMSQKIYVFGTTSCVTHVSRGLGIGPLQTPQDAKWGHYEVFTHQHHNPYNSIASGSYGPRIASFS